MNSLQEKLEECILMLQDHDFQVYARPIYQIVRAFVL